MPPFRLSTIVSRTDALLAVPHTDNTVVKIATAVRLAASAPEIPDDAPDAAEVLEELEAAFLSAILFEELLDVVHCAPLWPLVHNLIQRRFSATIIVPSNDDYPGQLSRRIGLALVRRLEALSLTEIPNACEDFDLQYEAQNNRRAAHRHAMANNHGQQAAAPNGGGSQDDDGSNGGPAPARRS